MKLSQFETIVKNNLPKWEVEIYSKNAKLSLKDCWSRDNEIHSSDLDYIKQIFEISHITVTNNARMWERNNIGITSVINLTHHLEFEKEEWEEY